jgi:hypothetical protein
MGHGRVFCECPDFRSRHAHGAPLCKHLIAVLREVLHASLQDVMRVAQAAATAEAAALDEALLACGGSGDAAAGLLEPPRPAVKRPRLEKVARGKRPDIRIATPRLNCECCICLLPLRKEGAATEQEEVTFCGVVQRGGVSGCGNHFHTACINAWVRVTRRCPLCKLPWVDGQAACQEAGICESSLLEHLDSSLERSTLE